MELLFNYTDVQTNKRREHILPFFLIEAQQQQTQQQTFTASDYLLNNNCFDNN